MRGIGEGRDPARPRDGRTDRADGRTGRADERDAEMLPGPSALYDRDMTRIFAVSDIHGHPDTLRAALRVYGLIDQDDTWTAGEDHLWVLGDLVDRGPDGIEVIDLVRHLMDQTDGQVRCLLGNHDALTLAAYRCTPGGVVPEALPEELREASQQIASAWLRNGGQEEDLEALDQERADWLASLPLVAVDGDALLQHSDIDTLLEWGEDIEAINARGREMVASEDPRVWFELWATLTGRRAFWGDGGADRARAVLDQLGGEMIVHGHSIIGDLTEMSYSSVRASLRYADGLALAIDGGIYMGGPCLLPELTGILATR